MDDPARIRADRPSKALQTDMRRYLFAEDILMI
jgi:hypothetical protein